jgi:signal transduction histidine kinase/tetratricopeptide (TPR) repeat protein
MTKWCLVFLAFTLSVAAQENPSLDALLKALSKSREDSVRVNLLNDIALAYQESDSVKGMAYGRKALALSKKLDWREGISHSLFRIGTQYSANFKYRFALAYFEKALVETRNKRHTSAIYNATGNVHMNESHYSKALSFYHKALNIDEELGDKKGIATTSMNIASVYYSIQDFPKSLSFFDKALKQKVGSQKHEAALLRNMAAAYNSMGQSEKALDYFQRSLHLSEAMGNDAFVSSLLSDIALTYYDMEDYGKAIFYCKRSLDAAPKDVRDKINTAFAYGIIGDSYTEKARRSPQRKVMLDSAFYYLNQSIALHEELGNIRGLYDDYSSLTTARKLSGDFGKALAAYEKAIVYKDSIFNSDNRETIKNLEDKRAIEIRDRELKINRITLEAEEKRKWFLILGIALLLIIGALLFYQSNNRKRTNRKLNRMNRDLDRANRIKTRLLSILNHDLRSPVNSFIHFIQFQKETPDALDDETKKRIENATIDSAKNLLESMEDMLLWTKDQMEHFEPQQQNVAIDAIFSDLDRHFSNSNPGALVFENRQNLSVFTDGDYLKTILRNLISNAIKALDGQPGTISVVARSENNKAIITVSDNGKGGSAEQFSALFDDSAITGVQSGLGLHLIRDFAKAIGWRISVASTPGQGTTVTLQQ